VPEYYSVRKTCEDNEQYRINITVDKQSFFRRSKRERNFPPFFLLHKRAKPILPPLKTSSDDDDVFYLFLQKQKIGAELHIYLEEGTYHKRLFRGPNTNDMKK